jgi:hypothetical protein
VRTRLMVPIVIIVAIIIMVLVRNFIIVCTSVVWILIESR